MLIEDILDLLNINALRLSSIIGCNRSAVSHWVNGTRKVSDDAIYRLNYYLKGMNKQIDTEIEIIIKEIEK